jgi:hypothetical protein
VPAMGMLPGGPPWIAPDLTPVADPITVAEELVDTFAAVKSATEEAEVELHAPLTELEGEIEAMEEALEAKDAVIRTLQAELRRNRRFSVPIVYGDPVVQFRLELHLDYLTRVEEHSRDRYPWPALFFLGPTFLPTVVALVEAGGIRREKIVEVSTDVLCGRARDMNSRAVKAWISSPQGPQLRRSDGAVAFRVRLQTGTASARRLRYWLLPTGEIELDWVGVHDSGL